MKTNAAGLNRLINLTSSLCPWNRLTREGGGLIIISEAGVAASWCSTSCWGPTLENWRLEIFADANKFAANLLLELRF